MPVLLNLDDLPSEVLADLRRSAAANQRTLEQEAAEVLTRLVRVTPRGPLPPPGEPIPSLEMSAPYDLPLQGPAKRVTARKAGPLKLEFWYGEDEVGE